MFCWLRAALLLAVAVLGSDFVHEFVPERMLFGSCNKQHAAQPLWAPMKSANASAFFWTGDAVYPNRSDVAALGVALDLQSARPEYREFLKGLRVVDGTWDDHDLGVNDAGREARDLTERLALYVDFLVRSGTQQKRKALAVQRGGAYCSHRFGSTVKVILLDTRSFRDAHLVPSVGAMFRGVPVVGRAMPLLAAAIRFGTRDLADLISYQGDVLGEAQWLWLQEELESDATAFTVVVSSIQVATSNPSFESWAHFPAAKRRLHRLLSANSPETTVLLSGDVHHAETARFGQVPEVTSSGLTHTLQTSKLTRLLFPPLLAFFSAHRTFASSYDTSVNYGQIDLDDRRMLVTVRGRDGQPLLPGVSVVASSSCSSSSRRGAGASSAAKDRQDQEECSDAENEDASASASS